MSLVHLSHVCSHLQNASLARLGLTSIPYTKMHMQIAVLLQKQGFFSTVDLAGGSPPMQRYPPGTQHSQLSPDGKGETDREAALVRLVRRREKLLEKRRQQGLPDDDSAMSEQLAAERKILLEKGFSQEDVDWATANAHMSTQQLLEDGVEVEAMGVKIDNVPLDSTSRTIEQSVITRQNRASRRLWLGLKYWNGEPVLRKAQMISKPTKRIWLNRQDLGRIVRGSKAGEVMGLTRIGEVMAVSTDRGIMDVRECVERQIGGQPLARFWG